MRNVKLFLASGNALKKDRDEIMLFLANKNQFLVKHGIFLELVRWEFLSSSFSDTRKQDDFNKEMEDSEIFTCLIFDRIGQYTKEEFDIAYQNYKQGKNPKKFYLYFKKLPKGKREEAVEVYEFKKAIEKEEQIYREYKNPDQLKLFLNQNLDEDLPGILKEALLQNIYEPEAKPMTETIPDYILDNLDEADKMLSKELSQEALSIYSEALTKINKKSNPLFYGKIITNIALCHRNLCYIENQEANLIKAELKINDALLILSPETHRTEYIRALICYCEIQFVSYFLNHSKDSLLKCIDNAIRVISLADKNHDKEVLWEMNWMLGSCYNHLMINDTDIQHFNNAVHYYDKTLSELDPKEETAKYSKVLSAKGSLFITSFVLETEKEIQIQRLQDGLKMSEESLLLMKPDTEAMDYAHNLSTLSIGYLYLGQITNTLQYYLKSLEYSKKNCLIMKDFNKTADFISSLDNQSIIFQQLYSITQDIAYLEQSIDTCHRALNQISIKTFPYHYGRFHVSIGRNYYNKGKYATEEKDKISLFHLSLEEYELAELVLTKDKYLIDYKWLLNLKIQLFFELSKVDEKTKNRQITQELIEVLLSCYHEDSPKDKFYHSAVEIKKALD